MNKAWKISYYASTALLSLAMLASAYFELIQAPDGIALFEHLGYPMYLLGILGVAKVLGVIGIWQNKVIFLKEWAYAGFVIDLGGAIASHATVGDPIAAYASAIVLLAVTILSRVALARSRPTGQ